MVLLKIPYNPEASMGYLQIAEKLACFESFKPDSSAKLNGQRCFDFSHLGYLSVKMNSSILVLITSNEIGFTK